MKKLIGTLLIILFLNPLSYAEENVNVSEWKWVTVMNPDGIKNGNGKFLFKDTCGIDYGGVLYVVSDHGDDLLVEYKTANQVYGTNCPSGTVFFIPKTEFVDMNERYRKKKQEINNDKN